MSQSQSVSDWTLIEILKLIYFAGLTVVIMPISIHLMRLYRTSRRLPGRYQGDSYVVESNQFRATYSFFNIIVLGNADRLSTEEKKMVILHEQCHGRMLHTLDVILATIALVLFWFNPLVWLYRRSLIRVHEYQADHYVTTENSPRDYSLLLAKSALMSSGLLLTHHLSQSFILKRINMINQIKKNVNSWKLLTIAVVTVAYAVAVSCTDQTSETMPAEISQRLAKMKLNNPNGTFEAFIINPSEINSVPSAGQTLEYLHTSQDGTWVIVNRAKSEEVFTIVQEPAFPTGGITPFFQRISQVLQYPEEAARKGIEGKVFVEFVVGTDGNLSAYKVVRGLDHECDAAALKAIMDVQGGWTPAMQDGKKVPQRMVLPITFKLN